MPKQPNNSSDSLHLQTNDLEKAVELLGEALQTRIAAHGGPLVPLCLTGSRNGASHQHAHWPNCGRIIKAHAATPARHATELAEECGACYHRYGAALFYRAQEESDVFGKPLRQAALSAEPQGAAGPAGAHHQCLTHRSASLRRSGHHRSVALQRAGAQLEAEPARGAACCRY